MKKQVIRTTDAPVSALYSQAVTVGDSVYVSGMTRLDPKSNQLAGTTIQQQTRQAIFNCQTILAAGATLEHVVSVLVLLARAWASICRTCSCRSR